LRPKMLRQPGPPMAVANLSCTNDFQ
jgi:hypothetical protein